MESFENNFRYPPPLIPPPVVGSAQNVVNNYQLYHPYFATNNSANFRSPAHSGQNKSSNSAFQENNFNGLLQNNNNLLNNQTHSAYTENLTVLNKQNMPHQQENGDVLENERNLAEQQFNLNQQENNTNLSYNRDNLLKQNPNLNSAQINKTNFTLNQNKNIFKYPRNIYKRRQLFQQRKNRDRSRSPLRVINHQAKRNIQQNGINKPPNSSWQTGISRWQPQNGQNEQNRLSSQDIATNQQKYWYTFQQLTSPQEQSNFNSHERGLDQQPQDLNLNNTEVNSVVNQVNYSKFYLLNNKLIFKKIVFL